jgi:hypothetical protein
MNRAWVVVALAAVAMAGRAESPKPQGDALVTVFTYDRASVPWFAMARAERVATKAFAAAGIEVKWVNGRQLGEPRKAASGETLTVVFDPKAPAQLDPDANAATLLGGQVDANVHVFYDRVARFKDRVHMPEFLGDVLAHELTHALEGVARHSSEGLMKPAWDVLDHGKMVRGPLPFAAVDLELLRAHFRKRISSTPGRGAAR